MAEFNIPFAFFAGDLAGGSRLFFRSLSGVYIGSFPYSLSSSLLANRKGDIRFVELSP